MTTTICIHDRIDIIQPHPGEYVGSLLAQGHVEDARQCQVEQYVRGFRRAVTSGRPVFDAEPAAEVAGFEAGQEWLANGDTVDWLPELAAYIVD